MKKEAKAVWTELGRRMIASTAVISKPGAVMKVVRVELTPYGRRRLTVRNHAI